MLPTGGDGNPVVLPQSKRLTYRQKKCTSVSAMLMRDKSDLKSEENTEAIQTKQMNYSFFHQKSHTHLSNGEHIKCTLTDRNFFTFSPPVPMMRPA